MNLWLRSILALAMILSSCGCTRERVSCTRQSSWQATPPCCWSTGWTTPSSASTTPCSWPGWATVQSYVLHISQPFIGIDGQEHYIPATGETIWRNIYNINTGGYRVQSTEYPLKYKCKCRWFSWRLNSKNQNNGSKERFLYFMGVISKCNPNWNFLIFIFHLNSKIFWYLAR